MKFVVKSVAVRFKEKKNEQKDYNDCDTIAGRAIMCCNTGDDHNTGDCHNTGDDDHNHHHLYDKIYKKLVNNFNLNDNDNVSLGLIISLLDDPEDPIHCYKMYCKNACVSIVINDSKARSMATVIGIVNGKKVKYEIQLIGSSGLTMTDYLFYNSMIDQHELMYYISQKIKKGLINPFKLLEEYVSFLEVVPDLPNNPNPVILSFFKLYHKNPKAAVFASVNTNALVDSLLKPTIKVLDTKNMDIVIVKESVSNIKYPTNLIPMARNIEKGSNNREKKILKMEHTTNNKYVSSKGNLNLNISTNTTEKESHHSHGIIKNITINTLSALANADTSDSTINKIIPQSLIFEITTMEDNKKIIAKEHVSVDDIVKSYINTLNKYFGCSKHKHDDIDYHFLHSHISHQDWPFIDPELIDMKNVSDHVYESKENSTLRKKNIDTFTITEPTISSKKESNITELKESSQTNKNTSKISVKNLTPDDLINESNTFVHTIRNIIVNKNSGQYASTPVMDIELNLCVEHD